jgi:hypothetical protein
MHIFRHIFLSNYWWQRSDIWSQASYRYPISWEAFLFDITCNSNTTSFFRFVNKRAIYRLGIISLAHAPVHVTDFPVVNVHVDELSSAQIVGNIVRKHKYKQDELWANAHLWYPCSSEHICTFFVTFFSATIDGWDLIFGHKLHICTPYRGKCFCTRQIPTSCLPTSSTFDIFSLNKMNCELMLTYDTPALRQTGSRNLTGQKTLPTIWGTYKKLVTKYQISTISSCWEKH